jgi:hypothetical protein
MRCNAKPNFIANIRAETARDSIKAVDVFVFLHGEPNKLWFYEGSVSSDQLGKDILAAATRGKLRFAYNTACFGATHLQNFLNAGFTEAVGAIAINSNAATEYPVLLEFMSLGQAFSLGISAGNVPQSNETWDAIARASGLSPVNSQKNIGGELQDGFLYSAEQWMLNGWIPLIGN